jgi:hypothetical protein
MLALGLAATLAFAAEISIRVPPTNNPPAVTALLAAGAIAGLCLGLSVILEKGWLTASLALVGLALAWIERERPVAAWTLEANARKS